ncbi:hypothetical protein CTI12_AA046710 [Artemisia annua]|uniref:Uncharacterized protein n=1 Tax=Artemisia annua TaxID=35608 RepID=A0A2U1QBY0_ARTAN|nr:hypothetical protein CTI12_AA046710 [Artemisia annua]
MLQNVEFDIKKEVAWAISDATYGVTNEQIKIMTVSIEGLENTLKVGEVEKNLGKNGEVNFYAQLIDDAEGKD